MSFKIRSRNFSAKKGRFSLFLLLDYSLVDTLVHAVNHDGEDETEDGPDVLEEDPVIH